MSILEAIQVGLTGVAAVGSAGAIVAGLAGWLGKVWAARILEQDRSAYQQLVEAFKARSAEALERQRYTLGKSTLVHRVQFEKEFKVYEELWSAIVELQAATSSLRPMLDQTPDDPVQERRERLTRVGKALRNCVTVVFKNRPFYHESIYLLAEQLQSIAHREALDYSLGSEGRLVEYYERAEKNVQELTHISEEICKGIRGRIAAIEVPLIA